MLVFQYKTTYCQISIAPIECYPNYQTPSEMDEAASLSNGASPFATWKGAYDFAITHGETEINFAPGTYYPGGTSGNSDRWGDADGGFELFAGMIINGNGAIIDNSANNNSIAFANLSGDAQINDLTFIQFTGNSAGAVRVNAGAAGWLVSNCDFDGCDWAGDGLSVLGGTGTISGCNFYGHLRTTGSALTISTGNVTIQNTVFSCNSRIVAGGAVRILGGTSIFTGCTFDGNLTNSSSGGALSIEAANVSMESTVFSCNSANVNTQDDGGAIDLKNSGILSLENCHFVGNVAKDRGGAIHASGASLYINSTTFEDNSTNTGSTSKGGAIFMNDVISTIDGSLFSGNVVTGEGGAIYVAAGSGGTYDISNSTFTNNTASGDCSGIDVFTERHITGSNNNLEFLADGWHATNPVNSGSLQFSDLLVVGQTLNAGGTYTYDSEPLAYTGFPLYWTCSMYTTGLNSTARLAYVLGGSSADLNTGTGYALIFRRYTSTNCDLEFVSYSGGINGTLNLLATLVNTSANSGSFAVKSVYEAGSWKFYVTSSGTSSEAYVDPRGFNYCNPITVAESFSGSYAGYFWSHTSTSSSTYAIVGNSYFRDGDETTGSGGSGASVTGSCGNCIISGTSNPDCTNEGSIAGLVFDDTSTPDGSSESNVPISGVTVFLYNGAGNLLATTTTNADGTYFFGGLSDGTYYVQFSLPSSYLGATYQDMGSTETDSDIDLVNFTSPIITINTSASSDNNSDSVNGTDEYTGYAHYTNIDAGFTNAILPVEWAKFEVNSKECHNILSWSTYSESNADFFEIQRSDNGIEFNAIGKIKANGNSSVLQSYLFEDTELLNVIALYRIRQVDLDGKYTFSEIAKAPKCDCLKRTANVFPNPIKGNVLHILLSRHLPNGQYTFLVKDILGNNVFLENRTYSSIVNEIEIHTDDLQSGIYFIHILSDGHTPVMENLKFTKVDF
ncbi:MAG: SdrD B-like domain-containing protein [Saprospiraceae bacterium]